MATRKQTGYSPVDREIERLHALAKSKAQATARRLAETWRPIVHAVKNGTTACGLRGSAVEAVTYKWNLTTCADCRAVIADLEREEFEAADRKFYGGR